MWTCRELIMSRSSATQWRPRGARQKVDTEVSLHVYIIIRLQSFFFWKQHFWGFECISNCQLHKHFHFNANAHLPPPKCTHTYNLIDDRRNPTLYLRYFILQKSPSCLCLSVMRSYPTWLHSPRLRSVSLQVSTYLAGIWALVHNWPGLTSVCLQALHSALHTFDMIESVLVRIEELTEAQESPWRCSPSFGHKGSPWVEPTSAENSTQASAWNAIIYTVSKMWIVFSRFVLPFTRKTVTESWL